MTLPKPKTVNVDLYIGGLSNIQNVSNPVKLSANESALGPSPKVLEIFKSGFNLKKYPDGKSSKLKETIAKKFSINEDQILIGSGSDEIISLICQSFLNKDDEVIMSEDSFLMYRIYSQLNGAVVRFAKNENNKFSVSETLKLVTNKTKIVFIANPNNPSGTYINSDELLKLRKNLPENILLMVDDAYAEFVTKNDYKSGLDIFKNSKNTVVSRTFSKIFGLANLRLGWGYGSKEIIEAANLFRPPFNISGIAEKAGCAAILDDEWIKKNVEHNEKWSKIIFEKISSKNIIANDPVANFFLLNFDNAKLNSEQAFDIFINNKILLRKMNTYGIKNSLRVTIGTDEENKTFLDILDKNF
ncbi:PLP-dependent enzyme, histidinol-phosphate/aromatic aminotransferase or cobyric acid decarboxylase [alpha proteobacterium HIMB114]|nr:PLP-dependent enzyme, histidinol-phosphate/aromatic aminotransferase or cobyric acid decarboxylase [alpha proteobacterium HIMB114]